MLSIFLQDFIRPFRLSKILCKTWQNAVHFVAGFFSSFLLTKFQRVKQTEQDAVRFFAGFFFVLST